MIVITPLAGLMAIEPRPNSVDHLVNASCCALRGRHLRSEAPLLGIFARGKAHSYYLKGNLSRAYCSRPEHKLSEQYVFLYS